ncbi:hypothetical protein Bache_2725 [Bacteroides helcogenes P 36-108]|uniref:Transmembrane protein n=1 Tax=Bacteroides helcogenes (strain ATCC 35417 / DSM 20613 / JCM 6297 / CCUG 15421 / P 36-108) TaxID=693979 RepID=E6SWY2_BACT6|nr:hypothetical protein Bache_2725 [Bacteroides helcogenes P 36-108]
MSQLKMERDAFLTPSRRIFSSVGIPFSGLPEVAKIIYFRRGRGCCISFHRVFRIALLLLSAFLFIGFSALHCFCFLSFFSSGLLRCFASAFCLSVHPGLRAGLLLFCLSFHRACGRGRHLPGLRFILRRSTPQSRRNDSR